jgi:hypothetical protein
MRGVWLRSAKYAIIRYMEKIISVRKLSESGNSRVPGSAADRLAMVWPLTAEAYSLSGKYNVEQRLQRHIVRLIRRKS